MGDGAGEEGDGGGREASTGEGAGGVGEAPDERGADEEGESVEEGGTDGEGESVEDGSAGDDGDGEPDPLDFGYHGYVITGVVFGFLAVFVVPFLFGVAAVVAGVQTYRYYDRRDGLLVVCWGVVGTALGTVLWAYSTGAI